MQRLIRRCGLVGESRRPTGADPEAGVTIVTVALLMTVILGLVGLGVDTSVVYAKLQQVQNAADAAAFAVAQEYALSGCVEDEVLALTYATPNVVNEQASLSIDDVICDGNSVRVMASAEQPPFFLSIVGAGPIRVPADATVEWGSPVAGGAFPLAFSECAFDVAVGSEIEVFIPKDENNPYPGCESYEYPAGGFGYLEEAEACVAVYADVEDGSADLPGYPGNSANKLSCDWASMIGQTVLVPIFVDYVGGGTNATYTIERFAAFELRGVDTQQGGPSSRYGFTGAGEGSKCTVLPGPASEWHQTCIYGKFVEYVSLDDAFVLGPVSDPDTLMIRLKS